jgi:hypothetical protein
MKSQKNEVVATFNDLDKAQAVKLKLEKAGIGAKLSDESNLQKFVYLSHPLACAKVLVEEADYEKARRFLLETDSQDHALADEVHCLKCGSPHIEYPQYTRKFMTTTFFGVLFSLLHLLDKAFYCQDCHHTWPVKDLLRPRTDIFNWPKRHAGVVKEERG